MYHNFFIHSSVQPFRLLIVETWMDLESAIQSEESQKEENKYHILTYICGTEKYGTDKPISRAGIEMQT